MKYLAKGMLQDAK